MADFDAGSIEGRLEVNRDPFIEGLRMSQEEARDFEASEYRAVLGVDADDAHAELDDLEGRLDELSLGDHTVHVNADTGEARAEIDALDHSVGNGGGEGLLGHLGMLSGVFGAFKGTVIASGIGALPALLGAAGGAALGAAGAFGILGASIIPFGLLAKSDFTDMNNTLKDLTKQQAALNAATTDPQRQAALTAIAADTKALAGPAGQAAKAYQGLQTALAQLKSDTAPAVFGVMSQFFTIASNTLPKVEPLITSTGSALSGVGTQINAAFNGPGFTKFIAFLSSDIGPVLSALTSGGLGFFGGLAHILEQSAPLVDMFTKAFSSLGTTFSTFTASPAFTSIINFLVASLPEVGAALKPILGLLGDLLKGLEPAVGPALGFISALASAIDTLAKGGTLTAIVNVFMSLATALTPLLPLLAQLINAAIGPLGQIIQALLPPLGQLIAVLLPPLTSLFQQLGPILVPVVQQLATGLVPILPLIGQTLTDLLPFLIAVVQAFAEFASGALLPILLTSLGDLLTVINPILSFLKPMAPIIKDLVIAWLAWNVALIAFDILADANPLGLIIIGVAALIVVVVEIVKHWSTLVGWLKVAWSWVEKYAWIVAIFAPMIAITIEIIAHWKAIAGFFEQMWKDISGGLVTAYNWVISFFEKLPGDILGWLEDAGNWLLGIGKDIIQGLKDGMDFVWNLLVDVYVKIPEKVLGWLEGAITWLYDKGKDVIQGMWNGLKEIWNDVWSWGAGLAADFLRGVGEIGNILESVGEDIITGLWNGLKKIWTNVKGWLGNVAGDIKSAITNPLGIFSPSTVMHEVGQNVMRGLHNGLITGFAPVEASLVSMANKIKTTNFGANGTISLAASASGVLNAQAQISAMGALAVQVSKLTTATKAVPEQTGDHVANKLKPVLKQQTRDGHQYALTRGRQGAVGNGG